jgi:uncharacterized protein (TIGR02271 family)
MVSGMENIAPGMPVYGADGQQLGTVQDVRRANIVVNNQSIARESIARVTADGVYLQGDEARAGMETTRLADRAGGAAVATGALAEEGQLRVPVAEERLTVGTREVELGQVELRKTVTAEEQTVAVNLRREEVRVEEVNIADRPLYEGETAFEEGVIRIAVHAEEPVVAKETVVTGEVVVEKAAVVEERQITETVRRTAVDVDRHFAEARAGLEQTFAARQATATDEWGRGRTFAHAEPNYRAGFTAAHDARYQGREFEEIEPQLRSEYETSALGTVSGDRDIAGNGDVWSKLREEIREGWQAARRR